MIDLATGWMVIRSVTEARADLVAYQVELAWRTKYQLRNDFIADRGKEFLSELKSMVTNDHGMPCYSISTRSPQANAIVKRVHQTIGNILCTFTIQKMV